MKLNSKKKMQKFIFSSKAEVLDSIKNNLTKSRVEKLYYFTVGNWKNDNEYCISKIKNIFSGKIIVRSSALGEDSLEKSEAGKFLSIQNVNSKSTHSIKKSIENVIKSYGKKLDAKNQVLIQSQTKNVLMSGVIFTKTLENGSPYYVINYEDGDSTDSVTKGFVSNIVKIHNTLKNNDLPIKWKKLIFAVKEIESLTNNDKLDIEFAITKSDIVIFQIRPLTAIKNNVNDSIKKKIENEIIKNQKKFLKIKHDSKINKNIIFSNMTDWNPAEIIGNKPKMLDFSLYNHLIMNDSWIKGRYALDYARMENLSLMENFSGYPYVNIQKSFYSFFPSKMNKKLREKLMNYFLKKLQSNPYLHDKVEFEILFSCYDFSLDRRLNELKDFGFNKVEIQSIKTILRDFTNEIIKKTPHIIPEVEDSIKKLNDERENMKFENNYTSKFKAAELLLYNCKKYGAVQFSTVARLAFISTILLKGLYEIYGIKKEKIDRFMNSIVSPVTEFQNDLYNLKNKKITKKDFLEQYGHLRPGTYDITATRYDQIPEFIEDLLLMEIKKPMFDLLNSPDIDKIIKKHELHFKEIEFFEFARNTISLREKMKFEFTKSLSDAIELISNGGKDLGFTRDELSYLELSDIKKFKKMNRKHLIEFWKKKIQKNKIIYEITNYVQLPPIIFSKDDFQLINHHIERPNYITTKKITSSTLLLDKKNVSDIKSKIIIIENADPGFDWIFSKKPSGLITKYGGVASHMSIRCAELGLPAAIGCGEILFNKLKISSKITLDCKNNDILILEFKEKDDFSEEKKLMKSLGYIR